MRYTTLTVLSGITAQALGLAIGGPVKVAGRSADGGFTIANDTEPGVYSVFVDKHGVAHHTKLSDINTELKSGSDRRDVSADVEQALEKRDWDDMWGYSCPGSYVDPEGADVTFRNLMTECGGGVWVQSGHHYYSIYRGVATYFCTTNKGFPAWCTNDNIWNSIINEVTPKCGSYRTGWTNWATVDDQGRRRAEWSIGYNPVDGSNSFCGSNH